MYRPEHPNPIFERENWLNLNGEWEFEIDNADSGMARKFYEREHLDGKINVPFCPESELSGVANKDFMLAVWYKREVVLTTEQLKGQNILHFGAVDYYAVVFVNGKRVGEHKGGYSSFAFNISEYVCEGENTIVVYARDDVRNTLQPRGKQCEGFYSAGCDYTRTTGIWQTVWLEFVPEKYVERLWIYPNVSDGSVAVKAIVSGAGLMKVEAFFKGEKCGETETEVSASNAFVNIKLSKVALWDLGQPNLYDVVVTFEEDVVKSYFGLREVSIEGNRFMLNGRSVFQRLVLDQGFYPDGIYTAPTDDDLAKDIRISMDAGFNGARLHEKVFEPRFLYHCDKLGYMVWGEYGNWGLDVSSDLALENMLPEWMEVLERDFNHPAIIGWCAFNETWDFEGRKQRDSLINIIYNMTKMYDTTRPCIDASGAYHVVTDIFDVHDYEQDVEIFMHHFEVQPDGKAFYDSQGHRQIYPEGAPLMVSEYGGIGFVKNTADGEAWSYGSGAKNEEEFYARYEGLTSVLLDSPKVCGFCYTQLYDIEQEVNGLYTYEREPKVEIAKIREINMRKAKIEE